MIINLDLPYENNGGVDKREYSLNLIDLAVTQRFETLGLDERKEYTSISKKIKAAITANSFDVDFNKSEQDFINGSFGVFKSTLIESIDIFKLEKKFQ